MPNLFSKEIFSVHLFESLVAQFIYFGQIKIVIVIYSPPGVDKTVFIEHVELLSEDVCCYKCSMIVCGELNFDTWKSNMPTGSYLDANEGIRYMKLTKNATRVTHKSSTCIDYNIITKIENYEVSVMQECFLNQYHF